MLNRNQIAMFNLIVDLLILQGIVAANGKSSEWGNVKSLANIALEHEDDKNCMISIVEKDEDDMYEDFYDEMDNWIRHEQSMNMIFFGPNDAFMRIEAETLLHLISHTKRHLIPRSRVLLAWDMITDGKTAAFLQGREYLAFGSLLNFVPEEDLYYVNFPDTSVLNYFSKHKVNLHNRKFGILISAYRRYIGLDWFKNSSDINSLGYLFCGFPAKELTKITPEVFRDISVDIMTKLERCNVEQTRVLYRIATDPAAYGKPYKWTSVEIRRLGSLFTSIPKEEISSLQLQAVTAIDADIMKSINHNKLDYFTLQQILQMSASTRRIFILRMQLKSSLDTKSVAKKRSTSVHPYVPLLALNMATLLLCDVIFNLMK